MCVLRASRAGVRRGGAGVAMKLGDKTKPAWAVRVVVVAAVVGYGWQRSAVS